MTTAQRARALKGLSHGYGQSFVDIEHKGLNMDAADKKVGGDAPLNVLTNVPGPRTLPGRHIVLKHYFQL